MKTSEGRTQPRSLKGEDVTWKSQSAYDSDIDDDRAAVRAEASPSYLGDDNDDDDVDEALQGKKKTVTTATTTSTKTLPPPSSSSLSESSRKKKKGRRYVRKCDRPARKKPRGLPKRPLNAYNFFFSDQRLKIKQERAEVRVAAAALVSTGKHKTKEETTTKASGIEMFSALGKQVADRWKRLSPEERELYEDRARQDKKRYNDEMDEYNRRMLCTMQQQQQHESQQSTAIATTTSMRSNDGVNDNKATGVDCLRSSLKPAPPGASKPYQPLSESTGLAAAMTLEAASPAGAADGVGCCDMVVSAARNMTVAAAASGAATAASASASSAAPAGSGSSNSAGKEEITTQQVQTQPQLLPQQTHVQTQTPQGVLALATMMNDAIARQAQIQHQAQQQAQQQQQAEGFVALAALMNDALTRERRRQTANQLLNIINNQQPAPAPTAAAGATATATSSLISPQVQRLLLASQQTATSPAPTCQALQGAAGAVSTTTTTPRQQPIMDSLLRQSSSTTLSPVVPMASHGNIIDLSSFNEGGVNNNKDNPTPSERNTTATAAIAEVLANQQRQQQQQLVAQEQQQEVPSIQQEEQQQQQQESVLVQQQRLIWERQRNRLPNGADFVRSTGITTTTTSTACDSLSSSSSSSSPSSSSSLSAALSVLLHYRQQNNNSNTMNIHNQAQQHQD